VLVTPGGRVVVLAAEDAHVSVWRVVTVRGDLVQERAVAVPDEPLSAALTPRGDTLLVASRWGHALSVVALGGDASGGGPMEAPRVVDLPRDPSAVVASADGRRAFVAHAVGSRMSVIDLGTEPTVRAVSLDRTVTRVVGFGWMPAPPPMELVPTAALDIDGAPVEGQAAAPAPVPQAHRPVPKVPRSRTETITLHADQGFALARTGDGRVLGPEVLVDVGAGSQTSGYGSAEAAAMPAVAVIDEDAAGAGPRSPRFDTSRCMLPRGAALDAAGARLAVACLGSDRVVFLGIAPKSVRYAGSVRVAKGPVAVAVDGEARRAVVWSAFDRALSTIDLQGKPKLAGTAPVPRATPAPADDVLRGRALFHANFDPRVSGDGRACASCHLDGRDDALSWSSPGGRRQTPMLLERIDGTAPYGWDGAGRDLARHLAHTTARLSGTGLARRDVADIAAYLASLRAPVSSRASSAASPQGAAATRPSGDAALAARGGAIFESAEAECASCHTGAETTDGDRHDVKSAGSHEAKRSFDTPSLHLVARSAPYFHDGRYATLEELVAGCDGTMGRTAQLSAEDRAALVAYLEAL
jgi:mono/diheme cytochrome c family protein